MTNGCNKNNQLITITLTRSQYNRWNDVSDKFVRPTSTFEHGQVPYYIENLDPENLKIIDNYINIILKIVKKYINSNEADYMKRMCKNILSEFSEFNAELPNKGGYTFMYMLNVLLKGDSDSHNVTINLDKEIMLIILNKVNTEYLKNLKNTNNFYTHQHLQKILREIKKLFSDTKQFNELIRLIKDISLKNVDSSIMQQINDIVKKIIEDKLDELNNLAECQKANKMELDKDTIERIKRIKNLLSQLPNKQLNINEKKELFNTNKRSASSNTRRKVGVKTIKKTKKRKIHVGKRGGLYVIKYKKNSLTGKNIAYKSYLKK